MEFPCLKPTRWLKPLVLFDVSNLSNTQRRHEKRIHRILIAAACIGAVTGLAVAAITSSVEHMFNFLVDHHAVQYVAVMPFIGLVLSWASLKFVGDNATPDTADIYIQHFHGGNYHFRLRRFFARILATFGTLGFGGALGFEGISIYVGTYIGDRFQRRFPKLLRGFDRRTLFIAGAAAGVSAVFKAPATGAVFALEVPFEDDFARSMLLPTLVSSASSYITYVSFRGITPIFHIHGTPPFSFRDIGGALLLGVAAGLCARLFCIGMRFAKQFGRTTSPLVHIPLAGVTMAAIVLFGYHLTGTTSTIGPPYDLFSWLLVPDRAIGVLILLLLLRALAAITTVGGGGVGGVFIPLVICGALLGSVAGGIFHGTDLSMFVIIGIAAFLGAGYRVPLAAVTFIAEATGRPGYIVPGLLAAVMADVVMGSNSITSYQLPAN